MAWERLDSGGIVNDPPAGESECRICDASHISSYCELPKKEALLSESEDWSLIGRRTSPPLRPPEVPHYVSFARSELDSILRVYGRKVAEGEWRDYAIDHLSDRAVFSIFRRSSEVPLCRVEKVPALARKQGQYSVIAASGLILKRGHDLTTVLRIFEKPKLSLVR
jgi:hypothetical protein